MGRSSRKADILSASATVAREELETRWRGKLTDDPRLARLVTAQGAAREPLHRWLRYKQGFSPELVRLFLTQSGRPGRPSARGPVLDPFSGSGVCAVECARQCVRAVGVEALPSLVFLARAKAEQRFPDLPSFAPPTAWGDVADRLELPIHRAALMLAEAARHTTDGRLNRSAPPLAVAFTQTVRMMQDDLRRPLPLAPELHQGDARHLAMLADESVSGILTSPPYLSRHDYTNIAAPYEAMYQYWYPSAETRPPASPGIPAGEPGAVRQIVAHPRASGGPARPRPLPPAVAETVAELTAIGQAGLARLVPAYFADLAAVLVECARVLRPGGVCWMVVGGARLKDVYVPSDLIVAEAAQSCGLSVGDIRVARPVVASARKFGRLRQVAPREAVLVMTRR